MWIFVYDLFIMLPPEAPGRDLIRVRLLDEKTATAIFEYRNSSLFPVTGIDAKVLNVGDVFFYTSKTGRIEPAPREIWPISASIGIVRLRGEHDTLIDHNGKIVLVPTQTRVSYAVGNTVAFEESTGVDRVVAQDPISFLDSTHLDASIVNRFRTEPEQLKQTDYSDFGGFPEIVQQARELIELPLEKHADLSAIRAKPVKGVLFTGLPGTGKTMLARIIAGRAKATFYEIRGPEVFNKWLGQSEEIIRRIFDDAAKQQRAIIFFDELDSIAASRDSDSHEASRRVVAQLLTKMDGFTSDDNVIVIATTNRPHAIDKALRRPGRLNWSIHFPAPSENDRFDILRTSSRNVELNGEMPFREIAAQSEGWTAAELTAIWTESAILAVKDGRRSIHAEDFRGGFERVAAHRALLKRESREDDEG